MKRTAFILLAVCFFCGTLLMQSIPQASAEDLPKLITFTSFKVGSLGYTITSGFREAIEKKTPMKVRVEPYGTDVSRILPLKNKESEITLATGATGTCVSHGIAEFATKEWGPQPLRQVWRGMSVRMALVTRGDSGIKHPKDLKGKRVAFIPGSPAVSLGTEGILAFGNLTWDDVTKVVCSGYIDTLKGIIEGRVDAALAATVTPTVKEIQAGPHKAGWVLLPHSEKDAWARLQKFAPWMKPTVAKRAPGLPEGQTMEILAYPYSLWAYEHTDPDIIYAAVKAIHEGFDIYKGMHRAMAAWNIKQAAKDPSPVPYHAGAIRYFKEAGVWSADMDKWQEKQLKDYSARAAAFK
ncbi:MAG: TAXI family TRAP transporter solute-binding subunit [Thermodesulfobacteriota bacterium]